MFSKSTKSLWQFLSTTLAFSALGTSFVFVSPTFADELRESGARYIGTGVPSGNSSGGGVIRGGWRQQVRGGAQTLKNDPLRPQISQQNEMRNRKPQTNCSSNRRGVQC